MSQASSRVIVEFRGVVKSFAATRALDGVSLEVRSGEVLGLVGENGAGKSTLMKILCGVERPSGGEVLLDGVPVRLAGPADAMRRGLAMIHQELNLVDELTVGDNIFLGRERTRGGALAGFVDRAATRRDAARWLAELSGDIDPAAKVGGLSIARKQIVEIAKALSCDARVLVMDEPTAVLTAKETGALLAEVKRLRERGVTIVYISHLLSEVLAVSDRIVVLRDGRLVTVTTPAELGPGHAGETRLASLMVGREMADHFPPRGEAGAKVVLEVKRVAVDDAVTDVSFTLHEGEVFGLAGLIGAGRTELGEALVGLRRLRGEERASGGGATLNGKPYAPSGPREAMESGVAYLSEDRKGAGLVLGMGVTENITLATLRRFARPLISRGDEDRAAERHRAAMSIAAPRLRAKVDTLSGGNQQKVALARWLEAGPRVLILDEPTRGVDIGAKEEIYRLIRGLASRGMAVLVISSELNELIGLCHRIGVLRRGRLVATLDGPTATDEAIMYHAAGVAPAAAST